MDEAYTPLSAVVRELLASGNQFVDEEQGVRTTMTELEVEMPLELDVSRDAQGQLQLGSTPPLYCVDTTFRPSYHRVRLRAVLTEDLDGG